MHKYKKMDLHVKYLFCCVMAGHDVVLFRIYVLFISEVALYFIVLMYIKKIIEKEVMKTKFHIFLVLLGRIEERKRDKIFGHFKLGEG